MTDGFLEEPSLTSLTRIFRLVTGLDLVDSMENERGETNAWKDVFCCRSLYFSKNSYVADTTLVVSLEIAGLSVSPLKQSSTGIVGLCSGWPVRTSTLKCSINRGLLYTCTEKKLA